MKTILQNTKDQNHGKVKRLSIYLVLIAIILSQSCAVYQKTPVSLSEASFAQSRVKVINTSGDKISFKKIIAVDSLYYGIAGREKIRLAPAQINSIYLIESKSVEGSEIANEVIEHIVIEGIVWSIFKIL
jgi:ribosomal protein L20A (L18A)